MIYNGIKNSDLSIEKYFITYSNNFEFEVFNLERH
jgi:hypothetical protein